jgi:hypothetical protein
VQLLRCCPDVAEVCLVNGGDGDQADARRFLGGFDIPVIDTAAAMDTLDVVFEMSAQLGAPWATEFRARGGRVIAMCVGNNYVIDIERMIHGKPHCALISGTPYDEIWTLAEYEKTCKAFYEVAWRAPVRIVTHLWHPDMVERAVARHGGGFGYQPRDRWRIGIFEPNICMVKTCHTPLLAAEAAYRIDPASVEAVRVFSTIPLKDERTFIEFANSLDVVRHKLATFDGRVLIVDVMGRHVDAVISHHWENSQNYLWYEMLWGGYPLVHNSHLLGGCGYKYEDFDCESGALAYLKARKEHDLNLASYRAQSKRFLRTLDPTNPDNVLEYQCALLDVVGQGLARSA